MDNINPKDFECPCCMNLIYTCYTCHNNHNVCCHCYMKVNKCPLCRNENIILNSNFGNSIEKKLCLNKHKGCDLQLYNFDEEHKSDCIYNDFYCKFCKSCLENNMDYIKNHFISNCVNSYKVLCYDWDPFESMEKDGKIFSVKPSTQEPYLIIIKNQYFVLIIPKLSQELVNFYVFSTNDKYKLSNYKISILPSEVIPIYYKKMICTNIHFKKNLYTSGFTIQNMFLLNPYVFKKVIGNTTFVKSNYVEGEPGSAGNWDYQDYLDSINEFKNLSKSPL